MGDDRNPSNSVRRYTAFIIGSENRKNKTNLILLNSILFLTLFLLLYSIS